MNKRQAKKNFKKQYGVTPKEFATAFEIGIKAINDGLETLVEATIKYLNELIDKVNELGLHE